MLPEKNTKISENNQTLHDTFWNQAKNEQKIGSFIMLNNTSQKKVKRGL